MTPPVTQTNRTKAAAAKASLPPRLSILCDDCRKDIGSLTSALSQRGFKDNFSEVGLKCPHCGFWVHSYYTTPKLEQARKILANFKTHAGRSLQDCHKYEQKLTEFQRKHQKVQEQAKNLVGMNGS